MLLVLSLGRLLVVLVFVFVYCGIKNDVNGELIVLLIKNDDNGDDIGDDIGDDDDDFVDEISS